MVSFTKTVFCSIIESSVLFYLHCSPPLTTITFVVSLLLASQVVFQVLLSLLIPHSRSHMCCQLCWASPLSCQVFSVCCASGERVLAGCKTQLFLRGRRRWEALLLTSVPLISLKKWPEPYLLLATPDFSLSHFFSLPVCGFEGFIRQWQHHNSCRVLSPSPLCSPYWYFPSPTYTFGYNCVIKSFLVKNPFLPWQ